ncbi:MAG: hypothetical protein JXB47_15235 [Anaerolineae bacterium]|nr:hypothetical protein [Anaerolineae bacterium]
MVDVITAELLVEGPDDRHIIEALRTQYRVDKTFQITVPTTRKGASGIEAIRRNGVTSRLMQSGMRALGVVIDADDVLHDRWEMVCNQLRRAGYQDLPAQPVPEGFVTAPPDKPRAGIWLMPNNRLPGGMIEDFVAAIIIPAGDRLAQEANNSLDVLEQKKINLYKAVHRPKAFIHTWLAWQEEPGQRMGTATTAHVLKHDKPLAQSFVDWLNRLFNP